MNQANKKSAARIRKLRIQLNMTQPEFTKSAKVNLRTLQGWEIGTSRPDYENTLKLIAMEPK